MRQGKDVITYYKSDALNIANSVAALEVSVIPNIEGLLLLSIIMLNIKIEKYKVEYPFVLCIGNTGGIMVYTFMNYDDFNSKYNDILKIATCYSENFSFFTVRQIHKKDHSNEYFNFLDGFRNHEIPLGKIKTPRYMQDNKSIVSELIK